MKKRDIDSYFSTLATSLNTPTRIILTGGAASLIMGGTRPTSDIDFEIQTRSGKARTEQGIHAAGQKTGLASEYSSDIERWSMLNMPGYRRQLIYYKKFQQLTVYLLKPEYWSIGKLGRYLDSDIQDVLTVFAEQKTRPESLLKIWQAVLKKSPLSDELFHFKKHVEHFVKTYGNKLWGKKFKSDIFLKQFADY